MVKTPPFRWIGLVARHLTCVEEFSSILESDTNGGNTDSNSVGVTKTLLMSNIYVKEVFTFGKFD